MPWALYVSKPFERMREKRYCRTAGKGDLLGRRGDPARERGVTYIIPEPDHTGDGWPAVLAKPVHLQKYRYPSGALVFTAVRVLTTWQRRQRPSRFPFLEEHRGQLIRRGRGRIVSCTAVRPSSVCVIEIAVARQYRRCAVWMSAVRRWTGQINLS